MSRFHLTWLALLILPAVGLSQSEPAAADLGATASQIVERTNAFRKDNKLGRVTPNDQLRQTAQDYASLLARTEKFSHEADGQEPADRASQHGYAYAIVAENLAFEQLPRPVPAAELARQFVEDWEGSPPHRANMLDPDVTETGVAVARNPQSGAYYAVQLFGRPKSAAIRFELTNHTDRAVRYAIADRSFSLPPNATRLHQIGRPADVVFQGPEAPPKIRPAAGEKFTIEKGQEGIQIQRAQ